MSYDFTVTVHITGIPQEEIERIYKTISYPRESLSKEGVFSVEGESLDYDEAVEQFVEPFLKISAATVWIHYWSPDGDIMDWFGRERAMQKLLEHQEDVLSALSRVRRLIVDEKLEAESILRALYSQQGAFLQILDDLKRKLLSENNG